MSSFWLVFFFSQAPHDKKLLGSHIQSEKKKKQWAAAAAADLLIFKLFSKREKTTTKAVTTAISSAAKFDMLSEIHRKKQKKKFVAK